MTEVVAALIWKDNKFLICQRPEQKARGLLWEFVGGKTEPEESKEQALVRECREELDVEISVGEIFCDLTHRYPDLTVHLTLFFAEIQNGTPKLLEHADLKWISPAEIDQYAFCPADEEILRKIKEEYRTGIVKTVRQQLFAMRDLDYREFNSRLLPTISRETVIGVRTPALRSFAKRFAKTPEAEEFLKILPHDYYEENNLHGFLLEQIGDYEEALGRVNAFLPYVDNWATCDSMNPKALGRKKDQLLQSIREWIASDKTYTIRFGIGMLMRYFLEDDTFSPEYPKLVAELRSEEYYVNMMIAWYFATALAKQYDAVLPYLEKQRLECWTHNKTIQKAIESYRITPKQKEYLRTLKRKEK